MNKQNFKEIYLLGQGQSKQIQVTSSNQLYSFNKKDLILNDDYQLICFKYTEDIVPSISREDDLNKVLLNKELILDELLVEDLFNYEGLIEDQILKKYFIHYLYEQHRISLIEGLIADHNYGKIGQLMKDSFYSYKNYVSQVSQKQEYLFVLADINDAIGINISGQYLICLIKSTNKPKFIQEMEDSFYLKYHDKLVLI